MLQFNSQEKTHENNGNPKKFEQLCEFGKPKQSVAGDKNVSLQSEFICKNKKIELNVSLHMPTSVDFAFTSKLKETPCTFRKEYIRNPSDKINAVIIERDGVDGNTYTKEPFETTFRDMFTKPPNILTKHINDSLKSKEREDVKTSHVMAAYGASRTVTKDFCSDIIHFSTKKVLVHDRSFETLSPNSSTSKKSLINETVNQVKTSKNLVSYQKQNKSVKRKVISINFKNCNASKNNETNNYSSKRDNIEAQIPEILPFNNLACETCGKFFKSKLGLKLHRSGNVCTKVKNLNISEVKGRTSKSNSSVSCEVCGNCFTTKRGLTRHKNVHDALLRYSCDICGKFFRTQQNVKSHQLVHSVVIKDFKCRKCLKTFSRESYLRKHSVNLQHYQ